MCLGIAWVYIWCFILSTLLFSFILAPLSVSLIFFLLFLLILLPLLIKILMFLSFFTFFLSHSVFLILFVWFFLSDSFFCLLVFQSFYLSSSPFFLFVCLSQILGWLCKNKQAYFTFHPTDERLPWLKMQTKIWKKIKNKNSEINCSSTILFNSPINNSWQLFFYFFAKLHFKLQNDCNKAASAPSNKAKADKT